MLYVKRKKVKVHGSMSAGKKKICKRNYPEGVKQQ